MEEKKTSRQTDDRITLIPAKEFNPVKKRKVSGA
jgi:hypothetical protein